MPTYWSKKDERQYQAIKKSCLSRDARKTKVCTRMAAATVNKQRRKEGRTLSGIPEKKKYSLVYNWKYLAKKCAGKKAKDMSPSCKQAFNTVNYMYGLPFTLALSQFIYWGFIHKR